jgi:hypothetical protein
MYMRDVKNKTELSPVNQNKPETTAARNGKLPAQYLFALIFDNKSKQSSLPLPTINNPLQQVNSNEQLNHVPNAQLLRK